MCPQDPNDSFMTVFWGLNWSAGSAGYAEP